MRFKEARRVVVSGRVQGVGFRWFTQAAADELGVRGWVRNLDDGRVEAQLEGRPAAVEALIDRIRRGPAHASVDCVECRPISVEGSASFEVRR